MPGNFSVDGGNPTQKGGRTAPARPLPPRPQKQIQVFGDGNVVGNGNYVEGSGNGNHSGNGNITIGSNNNNNNTNIGNDNTTIINNPPARPPRTKVLLDKTAIEQGRNLAKQMHDQTDSWVANNSKVNGALSQVDEQNAYSFFKEYQRLARTDDNGDTTGVMHDAHDLTEVVTSVKNKDTFPALNALIAQAQNVGAGNSAECQRLQSLMLECAKTDDIDAATGSKLDAAVRNLLDKMSQYIQE